jgi:hypothetical protein
MRRLTVPLLVLTASCGGGDTELITPPPPPPIGFTLTLVPDVEEDHTAASLGWQAGIPSFTGTVTPSDSSRPSISISGNAQGTATIQGLPPGEYIVEAGRWLSSSERALLAIGDDALGFVGRWVVQINSSTSSARLDVPAARRKGLIISEWAFNGYEYHFSGFIELFNNSDTTVYLDGIIVGEGWNASLNAGVTPCSATAPFRDDAQGIWTRLFQRFPGNGQTHPLGPGESVVIATDAIDHRPLFPRTLDLSRADFEFSGPADADNPIVPNMIDIGLIAHPEGHGSTFFGLVQVPFVARSVDPAVLPRAVGPNGGAEFVRIPADRILDAFALGTNFPPPGGFADCPPLVNRRFDRKESRARGTDDFTEYTYSVSRRKVPSQGVLLQWSRNANADLVRTQRTPGTQ